ncbi:MAG TPA: hypothetical protein VGX78_17795 [Pirellulales bacterium]|nr:hypothetical protein [Pirellulales bacterium]
MSRPVAAAPLGPDVRGSDAGPAVEYRRLRAPHEHGATLVDPPLVEVPRLLATAEARRRQYACDIQGRPLASLAQEAHADLLAAAKRYTSSYRDVSLPDAADRILLAGHQPQLFHVGVWFKNVALARLARDHRAAAVNLVIDSDTLKDASLRVPGGTAAEPWAAPMSFDAATAELPFEHRAIRDRELFAGFGRRAAATIAPLVSEPLLRQFWPMVVERSRSTGNLGACLSQARHQLEGAWGLQTLELPQSQVCRLPAFAWFAAHMFAQLPRFRQVYNDALAEYRHARRMRSASHPVPDLAVDGPWLEAPFWVWTDADPRRRRVFALQQGDDVMLSDGAGLRVALPLTPHGDGAAAVERLLDLPAQGIRLRTRALTTTLFARLFLGELFLHGIGGAIYDQLTDRLLRRFFGLEPPPFMVLSATWELPIDRERYQPDEAQRIAKALRDIEYHPEQFVARFAVADLDGEMARLIETKRRWIAAEALGANARDRCRAIREANRAMQAGLASQQAHWQAEAARAQRRRRAEAVLGWREYAFCLHPEASLRNFLLDFLAGKA